jgi:hypothetical protein
MSTSLGSRVSTAMKERIELLQGRLDMLILQTLKVGAGGGR